jgi:hypothetical protein
MIIVDTMHTGIVDVYFAVYMVVTSKVSDTVSLYFLVR